MAEPVGGPVDWLDLVVSAARAVTPDGERPAAVGIRDGRIALLAADPDDLPPAGARVRLPDDEVLLPGLVDSHVHVNEPGRTEWEGFATATRAAAAGGVTTIVDMPLNSVPATTDPAALEVKRAAAQGTCHVDVGFWGGAVPANLGRLAALHEAGVLGFKCFLLDSGVPEFPPLDTAGLRAATAELAAVDALLVVHAEDPVVIAAAPAPAGPDYAGFVASRPPEAEHRAIATLLEAAAAGGCRVHVVHLSSAGALPLLAQAKADGVRVTVETCPHYLCLAAEDVPAGATPYKCCPPIRDRANADLLWQGLADGTIDLVVSDHSPSTADLKCLESGDFGAAWGGIASVQLGLRAVWTQARRRGFTLADVTGWMAAGPARLVGLDAAKGAIAVGADADLVAFAPDAGGVVRAADLFHRNPVTPYDGAELAGEVRTTWLRGRVVDGDTPTGRLLARTPGGPRMTG